MTNLYVFWRKVADPPSPWTRLTRTNQYLRFNSTPGNHWGQTGATTHLHPSATINVGNSVHSGENESPDGSPNDSVMGTHTHPVAEYSIENSNNNNPPGWGLDIIYVDMATWESSIRSFPEGSIIMSNGALVDASLERYSAADGKYIVHATPETTVGTTTPQSHTVSGSLGAAGGGSNVAQTSNWDGDAARGHEHTFRFASEAKYVEPRNLVTRLYHALQNTSRAVAGSVVFVDGAVSANWEILTGWSGGNLKAGNTDPTLSGSDTHVQSLSGNSSIYDGPNMFVTISPYLVSVWDSHIHPITGSLAEASHVPSSRLIIPARLVKNLSKQRTNAPQIIGLW